MNKKLKAIKAKKLEEDVTTIKHEPSEEELLDSWDRYLEEHWDELVARYKGKYVAIWKGNVYDSDEACSGFFQPAYKASEQGKGAAEIISMYPEGLHPFLEAVYKAGQGETAETACQGYTIVHGSV